MWSVNKCITTELLNPLLSLRKGESSYHFLSNVIDMPTLGEWRGKTIFLQWLRYFGFWCNQNILLRCSTTSLQLFYLF